jgi:hypothetical protein
MLEGDIAMCTQSIRASARSGEAIGCKLELEKCGQTLLEQRSIAHTLEMIYLLQKMPAGNMVSLLGPNVFEKCMQLWST